jgi:hypothetical protein
LGKPTNSNNVREIGHSLLLGIVQSCGIFRGHLGNVRLSVSPLSAAGRFLDYEMVVQFIIQFVDAVELLQKLEEETLYMLDLIQ